MIRLKHLGAVAVLATVFTIGGCGDSAHIDVDLGPDVDTGMGVDDMGTGGPCQTDVDCDDGVDCTVDSCNVARRMCNNMQDNNACDDGNGCTAATCTATGCDAANLIDGTSCVDAGGADGTCTAGVCSSGCASDADCVDEVACTTHTCDTATGICQPPTLQHDLCPDANTCTNDECTATGCRWTPVDDGDVCTDPSGATGTCSSSTCGTGCTGNSDCNDGVGCTVDTCDITTGACAYTPDHGACSAGPACTTAACSPVNGCELTAHNDQCEDSVDCTDNVCDVSVGCTFPVSTGSCDDQVGCTQDSCDPQSGCVFQPDDGACSAPDACNAGLCSQTGDCGTTPTNEGGACVNGAGDNGQCDAGACAVQCTQDVDCGDTDVCDGSLTCNTSTGQCVNGSPLNCNNDGPCTVDSCNATTGCSHVPNNALCISNNPCVSGLCGSTGSCTFPAVTDLTPCMTGAGSGQCLAGTCIVGCIGNSDCADAFACTTNVCNTTTHQCEVTTNDNLCAGDGVACTVETCSETAGCVRTNNSALCDQTNPCAGQTCSGAGGCVSNNMANNTPCMAPSDGAAGTCQAGVCDVECRTNQDCSDGAFCNGAETCRPNNTCRAGTPPTCTSAVTCVTGSCNEAQDRCDYATNNGACTGGSNCTTATCNVTTGCSYPTNVSVCPTGTDCQAPSCSQTTGCGLTPTSGNACVASDTSPGTCDAGTCVSDTAANQVVFRFDKLELEDPHAIIDTRAFGLVNVCHDLTDTPYSINFIVNVFIPALNVALEELINTDDPMDMDTLYDYSMALVADDLVVAEGARGTGYAIQSDCSAVSDTCSPTSGATTFPANYTVHTTTGNCIPAARSFVETRQWRDNGYSTVNQPTRGVSGCLITDPIDTLTLSIAVSGVPVALQLEFVTLAGTLDGANPTAGFSNGVIIGWMSEAWADTQSITVEGITVNLGQNVFPDETVCGGEFDARDTLPNTAPYSTAGRAGERGWWFMVNAEGDVVGMPSSYP